MEKVIAITDVGGMQIGKVYEVGANVASILIRSNRAVAYRKDFDLDSFFKSLEEESKSKNAIEIVQSESVIGNPEVIEKVKKKTK